ncbi:MAG: SIS domain-containing protein [Tannerellaceae bacterium]|jgi:tagatose-6-phosphate ketose/aldose isomerase|nr:SIS domain-containing protein [Tannerellaceae bacterium]
MLNIDYSSIHTYREIFQQPEMWKETYKRIFDKKKEISSFFSTYYNDDVTIIFTGAGTSSFVGNILTFILPKYNIYNIKSVATTDITTHPNVIFQKNKKYILVSLARSGNSPESMAAVDLANSICGDHIAHIFITCNAKSELARKAENKNILSLLLPPETNDKGLAMTSSFTSMLLASVLIFRIENMEAEKAGIDVLSEKAEGMLADYRDKIQEIISYEFERVVFLGSGEKKGIAEECHLKLQELTDGKIICLFDSFLGFRHGPKAVLNEKTLLVYLFSDDEKVFQYEKDLVIQINRQVPPFAQVYVAEKKQQIMDIEFDLEMIPKIQVQTEYDVVLYVLIGQMLGMFKSIIFNLDPDNPSVDGKISRVVEGVTIYK